MRLRIDEKRYILKYVKRDIKKTEKIFSKFNIQRLGFLRLMLKKLE